MKLKGTIHFLPKQAKILIGAFLITLSFGYYTGLRFVNENTNNTTKGIEEHYLGNENNENAPTMKFKKSEKEIIATVHNHVISMSLIFLSLGGLLLLTSIHPFLLKFLLIEPFLSIILTFGGIWAMWSGLFWFKYIIIISGITLTITYTISVLLIFKSLFTKPLKN